MLHTDAVCAQGPSSTMMLIVCTGSQLYTDAVCAQGPSSALILSVCTGSQISTGAQCVHRIPALH